MVFLSTPYNVAPAFLFNTKVYLPGQNFPCPERSRRVKILAWRPSTSAKLSAILKSFTNSESGFDLGRFFILKIFAPSFLFCASAKKPYTVSVGQITTPPFFKNNTASLSALDDGFMISMFYKLRQLYNVSRVSQINPVIFKFFYFYFFFFG